MFSSLALKLHRDFTYVTEGRLHWLAPYGWDNTLWIIDEPVDAPSIRNRLRAAISSEDYDTHHELESHSCGWVQLEDPQFDSDPYDCDLYKFVVLKQKKGISTAVLQHLAKCADRLRLILQVEPGGWSDIDPLPLSTLERWYGQVGFVKQPRSALMLRRPS